jgi:hypothetical protein
MEEDVQGVIDGNFFIPNVSLSADLGKTEGLASIEELNKDKN